MSNVRRKSAVLLAVAAMASMIVAEPTGWLEYRRSNWPVFSYPSGYIEDPRSFGGVNQADEGSLRICILTSPSTDLKIISSNYGFVPDIHRSAGGFDSPRDVLLASLGGDPFRIHRAQEPSFEVFRVMGDSSLKVYFLMNDAEWGQCFEFLEFLFEKQGYSKHAATIDRIVGSFKPSFCDTLKESKAKPQTPVRQPAPSKKKLTPDKP